MFFSYRSPFVTCLCPGAEDPRAVRAVLQAQGQTCPQLGLPLAPGASGRGLGKSNPALDPDLPADTTGTFSAPAHDSGCFWGRCGHTLSFQPKQKLTPSAPWAFTPPTPASPKWPSLFLQKGEGQTLHLRAKLPVGQTIVFHCLWAEGRKWAHLALPHFQKSLQCNKSRISCI